MTDRGANGLEAAIAAWSAIVGSERIWGAAAAQATYGADTGQSHRAIAGAVRPARADQVAPLMAAAHAHGVTLHPISTGHNWGYGTALPPEDGQVLLDLRDLNRIVDFDAELGVVTLEPGVTQQMLADFLAAGGHPYLVPTTGAGPSCSLLANALERGYGITPISDHFQAVTDLKAVRPDGTVFETEMSRRGAEDIARLYRWGIGPYSQGLFTQARGAAGVVTQATIVLARRPEAVQIGMFSLADDALLEEAVLRVRQILSDLPGVVGGINLMNQLRVLSMSVPYPHEEVGPNGVLPPEVVQRLGRQQQVAPWTGVITLYGTKKVVAAARKEIRQRLRGVGSRLLFISPRLAEWAHSVAQKLPGALGRNLSRTTRSLRGALELVEGRPNRTALPLAYWRLKNPPAEAVRQWNPAKDGCGLLWYAPLVPMRPHQARAHVEATARVLVAHGLEPLITLTTLNDRVFDSTIPLIWDPTEPGATERAHAAQAALLAAGRSVGTHPYRESGVGL